jgi:hypothetical protein
MQASTPAAGKIRDRRRGQRHIPTASALRPGFGGIAPGSDDTSMGTSVYVVGNHERLGSRDPKRAQILVPDGPYPRWTGYIDGLPADSDIQWKCIKRLEGGDQHVIEWEPGANNGLDSASAIQVGDFGGG